MKNLFLLCIVMISCNQQADKNQSDHISTVSLKVDSLNAVFLAGWHNRDSAVIMKTISENAIVMNDARIHRGKDSIAKNWISGGIKVPSNINTVSLNRKDSEILAYDAGIYSLDLIIPGGPVLKEKGNYSKVLENGD